MKFLPARSGQPRGYSQKHRYFDTLLLLLLCACLPVFDGFAATTLNFQTSNYGLEGDGPGDMSDLLTGDSGSCHILTYDIFPNGGHVHVAGILGINSPVVDGDNLFEPSQAEA